MPVVLTIEFLALKKANKKNFWTNLESYICHIQRHGRKVQTFVYAFIICNRSVERFVYVSLNLDRLNKLRDKPQSPIVHFTFPPPFHRVPLTSFFTLAFACVCVCACSAWRCLDIWRKIFPVLLLLLVTSHWIKRTTLPNYKQYWQWIIKK